MKCTPTETGYPCSDCTFLQGRGCNLKKNCCLDSDCKFQQNRGCNRMTFCCLLMDCRTQADTVGRIPFRRRNCPEDRVHTETQRKSLEGPLNREGR